MNTRVPQQQRGIQTKQQIIEAAMRLFSQKGFHGTNTKEIARAAGVATGCFYAYFGDKKAVFMEALTLYFAQFHQIAQEQIARLSTAGAGQKPFFKEMIRSFLKAHGVFKDFHHELTAMYYTDPAVLQLVAAYDAACIGYISRYLTGIQAQLRVTDLEAAAKVVYWSIHSVVDAIAFTAAPNEAQLVDALADMIESYLFAPSGAPAVPGARPDDSLSPGG
jgi:AcrR family transcriptional regulator